MADKDDPRSEPKRRVPLRARREWNEDGSGTYTWFYSAFEEDWRFDESSGLDWYLEFEPIPSEPGDRVRLLVRSFPKG